MSMPTSPSVHFGPDRLCDGVSSSAPSAPAPGAPSPEDLGRSANRNKNLKTAEAFLNRFLASASNPAQKHRNTAYPTNLSLLTEQHVSGDHLPRFLSHAGLWLSENNFPTRQASNLSSAVRIQYFKSWKQILKAKFPNHVLLKGDQEWHTELLRGFKKQVKRDRIDDLTSVEERTSEPLYRTTLSDTPLIRAKYISEFCLTIVTSHL